MMKNSVRAELVEASSFRFQMKKERAILRQAQDKRGEHYHVA
jgi:hypothetical protein